jgi:ABC-type dipeptide/oligopeptide/nickel transport system permease component
MGVRPTLVMMADSHVAEIEKTFTDLGQSVVRLIGGPAREMSAAIPVAWAISTGTKVTRYIVARLAATVPVALGVATIVFFIIRLSGDPVTLMLGYESTPEQRDALRQKLGLDQPAYVQYGSWLISVARGDLGRSLRTDEPVEDVVLRHVGPTVLLTSVALVITTLVGGLLGVLAGTRPRSWIDRSSTVLATLGISIPSFWLGLVLIDLFAVTLGWLPVSGMFSARRPEVAEVPRYLVLPALTLALPSIAIVARLTRSSMLEIMGRDYVRTARAKGLHERLVITRHGLKNAVIPVVTMIGLQFGYLLSGSIIVESVFAWPGVGSMMLDGIQSRDFPLVQGAVLFIALAFVLVSLGVDLLYGYLDPRIRYA